MRFVEISMITNRVLSGVWLFVFLSSCTSVIPYHEATIEISDQKTARYPPSNIDLLEKQDFIFFITLPQKDHVLTVEQKNLVKMLQEQVLYYGNLQELPENRIQYAKRQPKFQNLRSEKEILKLGRSLKVQYASILEVTDPPKKSPQSVSAFAKIKIYQIFPESLILQTGISFEKEKEDEIKKGIKLRIQTALPQRGFILETKANRTWIKISLGQQDHIFPNRRFRIYRRSFHESQKGREKIKLEQLNEMGEASCKNCQRKAFLRSGQRRR